MIGILSEHEMIGKTFLRNFFARNNKFYKTIFRKQRTITKRLMGGNPLISFHCQFYLFSCLLCFRKKLSEETIALSIDWWDESISIGSTPPPASPRSDICECLDQPSISFVDCINPLHSYRTIITKKYLSRSQLFKHVKPIPPTRHIVRTSITNHPLIMTLCICFR